jgi:hypothetical protein
MRTLAIIPIFFIAFFACSNDSGVNANDVQEDEPSKIGFEIIQIVSANEMIVWLGLDLTVEEFDSLKLSPGWIKNQPRESDPDEGAFARSPNAIVDGVFTDEEHFGHTWRHNATVIEANTPLDEDGLLRLNRISKFHTVTFHAGKVLKVLVSPEGDQYIRITRDANRLNEIPTLPSGWTLRDYVASDKLTIQLPNPTHNIRADNEDSFQGPIPELDLES